MVNFFPVYMTEKFKNCSNSLKVFVFLDITGINEKVNCQYFYFQKVISRQNFEISGSWKEADILPLLSIQGIFVVFLRNNIFKKPGQKDQDP